MTERSRYPGTRPFRGSDRARFFARDAEAEQLYLRVLSVPLLVQFGRSGLGKTSLLQAGLAPLLRERAYLPVMVRLDDKSDSLVGATLRSLKESCETEQLEFTPGSTAGLWELLTTTIVWRGDLLLTPVLMFDQFEEVFTLHDAAFRAEVATELGALAGGASPARLSGRQSAAKRPVKIVISLREDYLGALEEFAQSIPGLFRERLRLEPFSASAAREAITKPALLETEEGEEPYSSPRFRLDEDALASMIEYLKGKSGVIEPFQLQLLCRHAEGIAGRKRAAAGDGVVTLTKDDFAGAQTFDRVLQNFYRDTLARIASRGQRRRAARLCEVGLLDHSGHRLMLAEGQILDEFGVSTGTLAVLCGQRLLTRERRHESDFYEVSHDRLADSIVANRGLTLTKKARRVLTAAAVAALCLIVVLSVIYSQRINRERQSVRTERDKADRLIGFLLGDEFLGELRDTGRSALLTLVRQRIDASGGVADRDRFNRGLARRNVGDIERIGGRVANAVRAYEDALASFDTKSSDPAALRELARTHGRIALPLGEQGRRREAFAHLRAAEAAWRRVLGNGPCPQDHTTDCLEFASALLDMSDPKRHVAEADLTPEMDAAFRLVSDVLFAPAKKAALYPDAGALAALSTLTLTRAFTYHDVQDADGAVALAAQASALKPQSMEARYGDVVARLEVAVFNQSADPQKALGTFREVAERLDELRRWDPMNREWQASRAANQLAISQAFVWCEELRKSGSPCQSGQSLSEAEAHTLEALAQFRALAAIDPTNRSSQNAVIWALKTHSGLMMQRRSRADEALLDLREAEKIYLSGPRDPSDVDDRAAVYGDLLRQMAAQLVSMGRRSDAEAELRKSDAVLDALLRDHPGHNQLRGYVSVNRTLAAELQRLDGNLAAAQALHDEAQRYARQFRDADPRRSVAEVATAHENQRYAKARSLIESNPAEARRELLASTNDARDLIRFAPAKAGAYSRLQSRYKSLAEVDRRLGDVSGESAALSARVNAAQIAAWLSTTTETLTDLLDARNEFAHFLDRNQRQQELVEMAQEAVLVEERLYALSPRAESLAALGLDQCHLGEERYNLRIPGWEEAVRSGIIRIEAAAEQANSAWFWSGAGLWHSLLADKLENAEAARIQRRAAITAYTRAMALSPGDTNARDVVAALQKKLQTPSAPSR